MHTTQRISDQPNPPVFLVAMATAQGAAAEAAREGDVVGADGPQPAAPVASGGVARRAKKPRIDLDDTIAAARAAMQKAQKEVAEARRAARNERRKKQRLVKKAGTLSADDLERIAVLKRCGLGSRPVAPEATAASSAAGSEQPCAAAASAATAGSLHPADEPSMRNTASDHTPARSDEEVDADRS